MDIILYNSLGCELDRASANSQEEIAEVVAKWTIEDGDYIKFEKTC